MKRWPEILLLVVVVAVLAWMNSAATLTIAGVHPGMARAEVDELLGQPNSAEGAQARYWRDGRAVDVTFEQGRVALVKGWELEKDGVRIDPSQIQQELGPADGQTDVTESGPGVQGHNFLKYFAAGLTVRLDDDGSYFILKGKPG